MIMLVGNKLDLDAQRRTPRALGEKFAEEEGLLFMEASAKSGDGVSEMFMEIGGCSILGGGAEDSARTLPITPPPPRPEVRVADEAEETPRACTC